MEECDLHRRIGLRVLLLVGSTPSMVAKLNIKGASFDFPFCTGASWLHAPNCPPLHVDQQHRQHGHDGEHDDDDDGEDDNDDNDETSPPILQQIPILEAVVVELGPEHRHVFEDFY